MKWLISTSKNKSVSRLVQLTKRELFITANTFCLFPEGEFNLSFLQVEKRLEERYLMICLKSRYLVFNLKYLTSAKNNDSSIFLLCTLTIQSFWACCQQCLSFSKMIILKHFAKTKKEETFLLFLLLLLQVFVKDWLIAYLLSKMLIVLKQNKERS